MSVKDLKDQSFKVRIDDVSFDVPVLYGYNAYDRRSKRWPTPTLAERSGLRRSVDTLQFEALLPDMEPFSEANASYFAEPGHGRKIRVSLMRKQGDWTYFFNNAFHRLRRNDDGLVLNGLRRYEDWSTTNRITKIVYLNHDRPGNDLIEVRCDLEGAVVSPGCTVTAPYGEQFEVSYFFGLRYLSEWPEIHQRLLTLLDRFSMSAKDTNTK